jgi:hypothetical protein
MNWKPTRRKQCRAGAASSLAALASRIPGASCWSNCPRPTNRGRAAQATRSDSRRTLADGRRTQSSFGAVGVCA